MERPCLRIVCFLRSLPCRFVFPNVIYKFIPRIITVVIYFSVRSSGKRIKNIIFLRAFRNRLCNIRRRICVRKLFVFLKLVRIGNRWYFRAIYVLNGFLCGLCHILRKSRGFSRFCGFFNGNLRFNSIHRVLCCFICVAHKHVCAVCDARNAHAFG